MTIPEKIDTIIEQRKLKLPLVRSMKEKMEEIRHNVDMLDKAVHDGGINGQNLDIKDALRCINTKSFHESYKKVMEELIKLEQRLSREQIHISFVGRARQGKSLIMQSISGLSGDIIPSSDGSHCTGAKSSVSNQDFGEVSAIVTFYNSDEYLEIVKKYLDKIFGENVLVVNTVSDILRLSVDELCSKIDLEDVKKQPLFMQLKKYIEHNAEITSLLNTQKTVSSNEIEEYVAQYSSKDHTVKYYNYLGVKDVNIMCKFPYDQCGKIALVDTIGLGDFALDIHDKMIDTVSKDSDVIVLVSRPDSKGPKLEPEDIDIVNDISHKMTPEYTKQMLFWILNKVTDDKGNNVEGIEIVYDQINEMPQIQVADILKINCKDKDDVEQNMLRPILDRLSEGLSIADKRIFKMAEDQLQNLYQQYHDIANQARRATAVSVDQDLRREFGDAINNTIKKMTNSVRNLYLETPYGETRRDSCEQLKQAAEEKLYNILKREPSKEKVIELLNNGTINQHNAYERLTDEMRLSIINDFLGLNDVLRELVVDMKSHVIHCLADQDQGRLGGVISADPDDVDQWLDDLTAYLQCMDQHNNYTLILDAIRKLREFDLRMESFLIYRVRDNLDPIDITLATSQVEITGALNEKERLADDIIYFLHRNLEEVYKNIKEDIEPLYNYPNSALWAVVKDFYDRIVYASSQSSVNVQRAWRYLYEDAIPEVWSEGYSDYQRKKGVSEMWNKLIENIQKYDHENYFNLKKQEVL